MDDKEYKRVILIATVFGLISLLSFMFLTVYVTVQFKNLNETINIQAAQLRGEIPYVKDGKPGIVGQKGRDGADGSDGKAGLNGNNGTNGSDGSDGEDGPVGPVGPQGATGATGEQGSAGEPGKDGRTVFQRTNPLTGEQECQYAGDEDWQPVAECR